MPGIFSELPRSHATGKTNVKVWDPKPDDKPADGPALVQIHLEEDFLRSGDI